MTLTDQEQKIVWTVVARFINQRQPTSRKDLLRKFKNVDALNALQKQPLFAWTNPDEYVPLPMAFQYCGDDGLLTQARQATELALRVLQSLDGAYPEKEKVGFSVQEFIDHAASMCDQKPDEETLMLGLNLATRFSVFTSWGGGADPIHTPSSFKLHEDIVTIDPTHAWDAEIKKYDAPVVETEVPLDVLKQAIDFDLSDGSRIVHRAAVRPVGEYDYHPEIKRVSEKLWLEGNFRQAVLDAFIHVIATVKERSVLENDGDDLMNRAFCPDNRSPHMRFNLLQTTADKDEQRGIWNLFKGVVGLRNFNAHIVTDFDDPHRAHEYLALASLLMRLLDMATLNVVTPQPPTPAAALIAAKPAKREKLVEIYGHSSGPGQIVTLGSEPSIHNGITAFSCVVTVITHTLHPVRIAVKRLLIDDAEWPVQTLFFQLKSRAKLPSIDVRGNDREDFRLYALIANNNLPTKQAAVIEFLVDDRDEPLTVDVRFP